MKIALAIVSNRQIQPKTVYCLMELLISTEHNIVPIVATEGYTTAEGRAYAVIQAQKNKCSHILFIDDDMTFQWDVIDQLLKHDKEIVGVWSHSRALPLSPTVAFLDAEGNYLPQDRISFLKRPKELFKCFTVGMGVCLIKMELFDKIEKPWFSFEAHESGKILTGEDAWLCKQARAKGIDIWCDPKTPIGHIGNYTY